MRVRRNVPSDRARLTRALAPRAGWCSWTAPSREQGARDSRLPCSPRRSGTSDAQHQYSRVCKVRRGARGLRRRRQYLPHDAFVAAGPAKAACDHGAFLQRLSNCPLVLGISAFPDEAKIRYIIAACCAPPTSAAACWSSLFTHPLIFLSRKRGAQRGDRTCARAGPAACGGRRHIEHGRGCVPCGARRCGRLRDQSPQGGCERHASSVLAHRQARSLADSVLQEPAVPSHAGTGRIRLRVARVRLKASKLSLAAPRTAR